MSQPNTNLATHPEPPESAQEVSLLIKSIEMVIRNFVRLLIGKITVSRLLQIVEGVFVEESEIALRKERPNKDVSLTRLALVTGLDTRKLARIRNSDHYRKPMHKADDFLKSMTLENSMVELWTSNPRFADLQTGKPRVLEIWGGESSFETLVREAIRARAVTVVSTLERMENAGFVVVHDDERVELIDTNLAPPETRKQIGELKLGLDAAGHLLATVGRNLDCAQARKGKHFQRSSWTHRLHPRNRRKLESTMRAFLESADQRAQALIEPFEEDSADSFLHTAGVGFYYFESESF